MNIPDNTPRHPIRVVAQRTGLSTATIRAWERRYGAVEPARSEGGQRLYSDHDLERLGLLHELTQAGRSIGLVAGLPEDEAKALLLEDRLSTSQATPSGPASGPQQQVDQAYAKILAFDAQGLERLLWRSALSLGGTSFLDDLVGPLLERVGSGWVNGEIAPAQEHLGSEIIDQVLDRVIQQSRSDHGPSLVVSTFPGERHGLGARLVSTAAVLRGWSVNFLGTELPVAEIAAAAAGVGAAGVAISMVARDRVAEAQSAIISLRGQLDPSVLLLVGGRAARMLDVGSLPDGVWIHDGLEALPLPPTNGYARQQAGRATATPSYA
jgi:DNA-binding transcriptional MerR regulator/methylmalonyl-CoA mutase cobalamin-binding subunit